MPLSKKIYFKVHPYIDEEGTLYCDNIRLDFYNIIQYLENNKLSDNNNHNSKNKY